MAASEISLQQNAPLTKTAHWNVIVGQNLLIAAKHPNAKLLQRVKDVANCSLSYFALHCEILSVFPWGIIKVFFLF